MRVRLLEMQAADGAIARKRLVILYEVIMQAVLFKLSFAVAFKKVAAGVGKHARGEDVHALKFGFSKDHDFPHILFSDIPYKARRL